MMSPAATIAFALAAAAPSPARPTPFNCQARLGVDGGGIAWVNLRLDEDRRPVRRELYIRGRNLDAVWDLGAGPLTAPAAMREFAYTIELPADAAFPVRINLFGDGRTFWSASFERATAEIVHYPAMERFSSIELAGGRGRPIGNIFGIRRLKILVRDARGMRIMDERLPLPDWGWIRARTRIALRDVERQRAAGACGPAAIP